MTESQSSFDVIVIGAGLGGLTAAARLAKSGRKVLVLEKEADVGGYLGPVWHGGYPFNNGPRLLMGCQSDGPNGPGVIHSLLEELGVRDRCEFIPMQPFATVRRAGMTLHFRSGRREFMEEMHRSGEGRFERLPELLALCGRMQQAAVKFYSAPRPWGLAMAGGLMAESLLYMNATMEDVLARYFPDARERSLVGSLSPYLMLPSDRASFLYWAVLLSSYVDEGGFFCRGGLHRLSEAVAYAFRRDGGELRLETAAESLLVEGGSVRGVALANGEQFFAPVVIANLDPRTVLGKMIDETLRPQAYLRRLSRMEESTRALNISLGFEYDRMFFEDMDARRTWERLEKGDVRSMFSLTRINAADPSLVPPGQHLVNLFASLPTNFQPTHENVEEMTRALLAAAESAVPGLQAHVLPVGDEKERGNRPDYRVSLYEPVYGWSSAPRHTALRRLGPRTPFDGLLLAGQWVRPGHGAIGVIFSGMEAARMAMRPRRS